MRSNKSLCRLRLVLLSGEVQMGNNRSLWKDVLWENKSYTISID